MKYANQEAIDAFKGNENEDYVIPLALLEQSFHAAGLNVEFRCAFVAGEKLIAISRDGSLKCQQSIEGNSPAQAVKDVAAAVKL
jgi:hypothetical protein